MKLRANKLKPLRFDPTGIFDAQRDINPSTLLDCARSLESVRANFLDSLNETQHAESKVAFYGLPRQLLLQYEADRHGSELARLFKMANRIHASVDRVVVLGHEGTDLGARVVMDGCCQPYWNELSRGDRGSKPRLYFDGHILDNDATQGLLHLLKATAGKKATSELDAWSLVVIECPERSDYEVSTLTPFVQALQMNCGGDSFTLANRFCAVMRGEDEMRSPLSQLIEQRELSDIFKLPKGITDGFSVFSAIGLVPAALLGVNVIELLVGAARMNEHFEKQSPEDNIALQILATNRLSMQRGSIRENQISVWNQSLQHVVAWQKQLSQTQSQGGLGCDARHVLNCESNASGLDRNVLYHNIIVDEYRFDELVLSRHSTFPANDSVEEAITTPELNRSRIHQRNNDRNLAGNPSTNLFLPKVDELHLGYLLQLLMIVHAIEAKMAHSACS